MGCLEATIKRETVEFKYCLFSEGWRNASESLRFFYAEKHSVARGEGEFRSGKNSTDEKKSSVAEIKEKVQEG